MTPSWKSSQDSGNPVPWFIVRDMAGHRWAATWRDTRGRGCGGAPPRPLQVQRRPSPSTWRQAEPGGRVGAPLRGGRGEPALTALLLRRRPRGGWPPESLPQIAVSPLLASTLSLALCGSASVTAGRWLTLRPGSRPGRWQLDRGPQHQLWLRLPGALSVSSQSKGHSCHPGNSRDPGAEPAGGVDRDQQIPSALFHTRGRPGPTPKLLPAAGSRGLWANWCFKAHGDCGGPGPVLGRRPAPVPPAPGLGCRCKPAPWRHLRPPPCP